MGDTASVPSVLGRGALAGLGGTVRAGRRGQKAAATGALFDRVLAPAAQR